MTPELRAHIRTIRDQLARERAAREALVEKERNEFRLCAYCGAPIPLERIGAGRFEALYCQPNHRQYAYLRRKKLAAA